ncbi:MAG: transglutaminase domain-containing protein, partial [Bacteroidota bacterium]
TAINHRLMKHQIIFLLLLAIFSGCYTTTAQLAYDFKKIDTYAAQTPKNLHTDLEQLSTYLAAGGQNELEQVRAIYQWILKNIEYDRKAYKNGNKRLNRSNEDVLTRGKAVCWGYANLLKAMTATVGIESSVISGYARTRLTDPLNFVESNHAWNAVRIAGKWYLLDVTWDSGLQSGADDFRKTYQRTYFLTEPEYFILNHVPANPIWQLLDCPISLAEAESASLLLVENHQQACDSLQYSIDDFIAMLPDEKRLQEAIATYDFNPSVENQRHLGNAMIDYQNYLDKYLVQLQEKEQLDSVLLLQQSMITYCEQADRLTDLFDHQKENCAYNYLNYAIALSRVEQPISSQNATLILDYIEQTETELATLKSNFFIQQALARCKQLRAQLE